MVCMSEENAKAYCAELEQLVGSPAWMIGRVVQSKERKARLVDDVKVIEV